MVTLAKRAIVAMAFLTSACADIPTEQVRITVEGSAIYVSAMQHGWTVGSGEYGTGHREGHTLVVDADPDALLTVIAYCKEWGNCDAKATARVGTRTLTTVEVNHVYPRVTTDVAVPRTREDYLVPRLVETYSQ